MYYQAQTKRDDIV